MKSLQKLMLIGDVCLSLALAGCMSKIERKSVTGQIYQASKVDLVYKDDPYRTGTNAKIPVTILDVDSVSENEKYKLLLAGPCYLKKGDNVYLDYLVDKEITKEEVWNMLYPNMQIGKQDKKSKFKFEVDGYINSWKIIKTEK